MTISHQTYTTTSIEIKDTMFGFEFETLMELFQPDEMDDFSFSVHLPSKSQWDTEMYFKKENERLNLLNYEESENLKQVIRDAFSNSVDYLHIWIKED